VLARTLGKRQARSKNRGNPTLREGEGHDVSCPYVGMGRMPGETHSGEWRSKTAERGHGGVMARIPDAEYE